MALPSIGGRTADLAQPHIKYPRDLDPADYEDLPPGWRAVEYAFKSGKFVGKTYVRFASKIASSQTSARKCVELQLRHDLKHTGGGDAEVEKLMKEFDEKSAAKKEARLQEDLSTGKSKLAGEQRDQAIEAFRSAHGRLDGPTLSALRGWRAESIFRETCQQTAVMYYNQYGHQFGTVMDAEAFLGLKVMKGEDFTDDVEKAKSSLQFDETGKKIHLARQEVMITRTAEDAVMLKENKKRKVRSTISTDAYVENKSLRLGYVGGETSQLETEWQQKTQSSVTEIQSLLAARGFQGAVDMLALDGLDADHVHSSVLQGLFYRMTDDFAESPCFQRVAKEDTKGTLICHKLYIYWNSEHTHWRIGYLDNIHAPFAFAAGGREAPPQGPWMVFPRVL